MDKVTHFEIPFEDPARAVKFYKEIFGWKIVEFPFPGGVYRLAYTAPTDDKGMITDGPNSINGALVDKSDDQKSTTAVITVDSIEDRIKKVEAAGGKVIRPKQEVPDQGFYALVTDTEGNVIGIWEDLPKNK